MRESDFANSPAYLELQPLRIPAGWSIGWNNLHVTSTVENGDFGGSTIFHATNAGRGFNIDVEFRPEHDPEGSFHLTVLYQPWPRTEKGRRRTDAPFRFDADAEAVHSYETRLYSELLQELERWIARCTVWVREGH